MRSIVLLFLLLSTLLSGCSLHRIAERQPTDCTRALLEPDPVWNGAAAWQPEADQLVLVDPNGALLEFSATGEYLRRVVPQGLDAFDLSTPVRLQRLAGGYLLGGQDDLLWLDPELATSELLDPFADNASVLASEGLLGDLVEVDGHLFAYADLQQEDSWLRGFVRLDPRRGDLHMFDELRLAQQQEWNRYYLYDLRPYMASSRQRAYALRLTNPPTVQRFAKKRLETLWTSPQESAWGSVRAIYADEEAVYVLFARRLAAAEGEVPIEKPQIQGGIDGATAQLMSAQLAAAQPRREWRLVKLHPRTGRQLATFLLPTESLQIQLLPGASQWAIIEAAATPSVDETSNTWLRRFPAHWLAATDGGEHLLTCASEPSAGPS